jgi:hypothetical protein
MYYTSRFYKVQRNFGHKKTFNKNVILFKKSLIFIHRTLRVVLIFHKPILFTFYQGIAIILHETEERFGLNI